MSARNKGNKGNSNRNHRSHTSNNQSNKNMNRRGNLPNPNMQGIYANKSMCHALTALVGAKCTVRTKNEENTFEGFFHCFSPTMDIIVSAAHKVNKGGGDVPLKNEIIDDMIFPIEEVVSFSFENTDLSYAIEDSFTDNAISTKDQCKIDTNEKYNNLQEWQPDSGDDMEIDGDLGEASSRMAGSGWTAEEMFNINTKQFGVKTSYDSKLTEYTVALKKEQNRNIRNEDCTSDSVRRANNLAREIESSANYQINVRHELDESVDDETKFSAVDENAPSNDQKGKYIPPSRREVAPTPPLNGAKSGGAGGVPKGGPVPAGGSTGQVAVTGGRNMSRNNSESEGKNKNRNQTSNSQKNQQSSSPMGGVKGGKDGKKDNRNRSSPISQSNNSKSQSSNQPRGPQPQGPSQQSRPSQPSQQGMAWNRIAGGGASNNNTPASPVTGATKRSANQNTTPNNSTNNVDNRKKTGEDLKKFSSNFLLPSDEKNSKPDNQTQNNPPDQGAASQSDQSVQNMPNNLGQPNVQQQPNLSQQPQTQTKRKTTPPPGLDKKQTGPPPGMSQKQPEPQKTESEKAPETPKKTTTKLNPEAKEWRPNVSAPAFKPGGFTPKAVQQQPPAQQQPQTPQMNPQSPPVTQMPQQPQYIPPAPYHQQPIYPYPGYPQQPGQFVPMPPQQIIHQGQPVPYTTQQPMSQPSVSQAPNQGGPKPRPSGPGGRPDRRRHPPGQTGSPHNQPMGQPGLMPGGQQVGMTQPNMFHPGQVNPQQPMIYQPDMVVPSIQHVGIQQRGGYDPQFGNYPQPMAPQTPTSQGPGQVVYHSGHPNQPGPNQIQMQPGPGHIISYQIAQPGQQPGMAPAMVNHPMYAPHPPRPQQMAPPGGQGGYPGQPAQPGQHPQPQH